MGYEHCEKHNLPATNGCAACELEEPSSDELESKSLEQAKLLSNLIERVEALPHIARMGQGSWVQALHGCLNLLETPNNVDALWVWSAFAQSFGQGDTWQAERAFNVLLNWTATRRVKIEDLAKGSQVPDTARDRKLQEEMKDAEAHCFTMLEHILDNFRKWRDLPDFVLHKRSLVPPEPQAVQMPLPGSEVQS